MTTKTKNFLAMMLASCYGTISISLIIPSTVHISIVIALAATWGYACGQFYKKLS